MRHGDHLHPLPEGLTGMIPTSLEALEESELLSAEGKARFAAEPDVPPAPAGADESVGSFVSRRFGREAYEALVEPLMTGIYGGDGDRLSLQATFPQLRALELEHGSVLRGLSAPAPAERAPFVSLRGGMDVLVDALAADLGRTDVRLGQTVERVSRRQPGFEVGLAEGETIAADGVLLATPAFVTAELVASLDRELADAHAEIRYASSVVVTLAFSRADVVPLDGYGYVVPAPKAGTCSPARGRRRSGSDRAPEDAVLLRVYAGRFGGRDVTRLRRAARRALARRARLPRRERRPAPLTRSPLAARHAAVRPGTPRPRRADRDRALSHPGLAVAGAAYRGVGIPDCIASGEAAAESVARALAGAGV